MVRILLIVFLFFNAVLSSSAQSWMDYYDSTYLYWEKDWSKTIALLDTALPLAEKDIGGEHPNYAVLLNDLGVSYWKTGNLRQATAILEKSIRIKKVSLGEEDPDYKASLLNLANVLYDSKNLTGAEDYYFKVIESYKNVEYKDAYYQTALNSLGGLYESQANYDQAEKYYLKALEYKEETAGSSHLTYAKVLQNLGNLYKKSGNIQKSESFFIQALNLFNSDQKKSMDYATLLSDYGLYNADKGDFGKAEEYLKKTESIIVELKGKKTIEYASSINNLGTLHWRMGKKTEAESNYKGALSLYEELLPKGSADIAPALNNLAGYYVSSQDYDKALPLYLNSKTLYGERFGLKHPLYANSLNNLASLYRKTKEYEKASKIYKEVLNIEKEVLGENHPQYASSLQNMALLSLATGDYKLAESLMLEAIAIKKKILEPQHPSWANTYNNLALLYFLKENNETAAPLFEKALSNQFNQIKNVFPALSEKEKEAFYNTLKDDIERFNTFALSQYKTDSSMAGVMYNNQLITKGLLFDASNKIRDNIFAENDAQLIGKYNKWRSLRDDVAHAYQLPKEVLIERNIDVAELIKQANDLEKELSSQSYAINPQANWQEFTWENIREKLSPDEAAIELIRFREFAILPQEANKNDTSTQIQTSLLYGWTEKINYAALIITPQTKENPRLVILDDGEALENKYYSYYSNGIRYQVQDNLSYQRYWKKIQQEIPNAKTVYFSPDGAFHKININTLYDSLDSEFLLNKITVKQLTSTRDIFYVKNNKGENNEAMLFGDPSFSLLLEEKKKSSEHEIRDTQMNLIAGIRENEMGIHNPFIAALPGTKTEVTKIYDILKAAKWNPSKYLSEEALEENIKKVNSPKVLHIATHGYFNKEGEEGIFSSLGDNNPLLNSGLLLAGAQKNLGDQQYQILFEHQKEDGILTAFEAMNLKLDNTDLVVLSACETGSGTIKNGEGVYGLQRSFQVAGAASIIFSLWKVDDNATQMLMSYFYKQWMESGNKREAFLLAQHELKNDYPDPYYWGAFILIGD